MNSIIKKIINIESNDILKGILIDLIQIDKQNEERFMYLYRKR